jgi:hypothetical protein
VVEEDKEPLIVDIVDEHEGTLSQGPKEDEDLIREPPKQFET